MRSILFLILIILGCDSHPDEPKKQQTVISYDLPKKGGEWTEAIKTSDGKIEPFRLQRKHFDWGTEHKVTTQSQWNRFKGMFDNNFVSVDSTTDQTGKSYELVGIEKGHIEVFDSKSGIGRFSNRKPKKCRLDANEFPKLTNEGKRKRQCGRKFLAQTKDIPLIQSILDKGTTATLVMEHVKWPAPEHVRTVKDVK